MKTQSQPELLDDTMQELFRDCWEGDEIGLNTIIIQRLREIVPAWEWEKFTGSDAFKECIVSGHMGVIWILRKVRGQWMCAY
jgi:hypothetical protein